MTMKDPRRGLIAIDTNVFDLKDAAREMVLGRFDHCVRTGELNLLVTETVWREISDPNTPTHLIERYREFYRTYEFSLDDEQQKKRQLTHDILVGRGQKYRHANDAQILSEAVEMGASYFVTGDYRILSKDLPLRAIYPEIEIRSLESVMKILDEFKSGVRK
jgi:hypothetical protein